MILCNIALHVLGTYVRSKSTESNKPIMVRYADDFVLLCKSYASAQEFTMRGVSERTIT